MSRPVTEEYLQHCFATFAQQLEAVLERKFGEVDKKFGEVDKKFGEVDKSLEVKREVKREFGEVDKRFDAKSRGSLAKLIRGLTKSKGKSRGSLVKSTA